MKRQARCLSLWQPWASLIACGSKIYETRSWKTDYRGPVVIHAAKRWTQAEKQLCNTYPFDRALAQARAKGLAMPFGEIICVVDLVAVHRVEDIRDHLDPVHGIGQWERYFGDYNNGRYAWELRNVRTFYPVPMRGQQGLFPFTCPLCDNTGHIPGDGEDPREDVMQPCPVCSLVNVVNPHIPADYAARQPMREVIVEDDYDDDDGFEDEQDDEPF